MIRPFVLGTSHFFIRQFPDWLLPGRNGRYVARESNWGLIETQAGKDRIDWEIDLKSKGGTVWVSSMLITGPPETKGMGAPRGPWKLPKWSHPKCANLQRLQFPDWPLHAELLPQFKCEVLRRVSYFGLNGTARVSSRLHSEKSPPRKWMNLVNEPQWVLTSQKERQSDIISLLMEAP